MYFKKEYHTYSGNGIKVIVQILTLLLFAISLCGQTIGDNINLKFRPGDLHVKNLPFSSVEILDNRIDSGKVYHFQNSLFPVKFLNFGNPKDSAIKKYFTHILMQKGAGNKHLLIDIEQLRISNKKFILRRKIADSSIVRFHQRQFIMFSAKLYYRTPNRYFRKIVDIKIDYYQSKLISNINSLISKIFNEALEAASDDNHFGASSITRREKRLRYLNDTFKYKYSKDTTDFTLEELSNGAEFKWKRYPIVQGVFSIQGVYLTFDDFRANQLTPAKFKTHFNPDDSTYNISFDENLNDFRMDAIWAIVDDKTVYFRLFRNNYLKMITSKNTFYFHIPQTIPNMFILLAIEETYSNISSDKLLLSDFTLDMIHSVIQGFIKKSQSVANDKLNTDFRDCTVDMDCGDIIY